ncbi:MAG: hypothetical protein ACI8RD_001731, partial [Bacillariaceae sp.]
VLMQVPSQYQVRSASCFALGTSTLGTGLVLARGLKHASYIHTATVQRLFYGVFSCLRAKTPNFNYQKIEISRTPPKL